MSLPEDLVAYADEAARREGLSRSGLLADLLEAARIREQLERYLDRYGWDIVEDEEAWRAYQRRKMARDYGNDEW